MVMKGKYKFEGIIGGVDWEIMITSLSGNRFEVKAEGENVDLTGTVNPVTVQLTIDYDAGMLTVNADLD
jgi:hypothetical protein